MSSARSAGMSNLVIIQGRTEDSDFFGHFKISTFKRIISHHTFDEKLYSSNVLFLNLLSLFRIVMLLDWPEI